MLNSDAIGTAELKARELFYRSHELGKTWFDVAAVNEILDMIPVEVDLAHPVQDRKGMKDMFRQMAPVRNELHDAIVSRIVVYKAKDAELSGLGQTRVEDSAPFVDNKIALFFSIVNGGVDG